VHNEAKIGYSVEEETKVRRKLKIYVTLKNKKVKQKCSY